MSADLEKVHTLPELREWLKVRLRWLRDWHMAPNNPKPIPPAFLKAILSLCGKSRYYSPPSAPMKKRAWANERVMVFSILAIHAVHDWLQTHDIFDIPNCPSLDPITNERILADTLEHLSALLNFVAGRASDTDAAADKQAERGKPAASDPAERASSDAFSEREREILVALLLLNAVTERKRVARRKAARKANASAAVSTYNQPIALLGKRGLIGSKKGPNGGIWLTSTGEASALSLNGHTHQ